MALSFLKAATINKVGVSFPSVQLGQVEIHF